MTIVLIGLMVVAFYFLMIRPQRKRQQKQQETLNALQPGTRVLLGSGVFGTILRIGDKQAVLELSPGTELTVLKQAIVRVAGPEDEDNPETVNSTVPEPEEPASTLDLKDDADAAKPEADEPGEQTWREYSIKQDDDTDETAADKPAADQPASEQTSDRGTGPGTGSGPGTGGGPGAPKD
ncbi:preprotein translocase subunit YajC [Microlunatus parietis]|uniref:Preprotein translocase subunit YajC n=1 Tax=Microlunatus parietis TaxID=682979 RepID=A0A7Y9I2P9_9ACTN|nr:preprotein translocase subunit YajC [Microlunatus parietis]NYE69142.1 preprotein translocase subunit YajC [Microlunatus parietis]